MLLLLLACARDLEPSPARPVAVSIEAADPLAPLSARLRLDRPSAVDLTIEGTDGARSRTWTLPAGDTALPLGGLGAAVAWTFAVREGDAPLDTLAWTTPALPDDLPEITWEAADPSRLEPGVTLFATSRIGTQTHWLVRLDEVGAIEWLYGPGDRPFLEATWDGAVTRVLWNDRIALLDEAGEVVAEPSSPSLHHELRDTAAGTWLSLSSEVVPVEDFPLSYDDPAQRGPALVTRDHALELDPATGAVLRDVDLSQILDPDRIGWDALVERLGGLDWSHCNALAEDPLTGHWVVSCRHQDAIVAFDPDTLEVDWLLANPAGWSADLASRRLTVEGMHPYHQHAVSFEDGLLYVYDNGNRRDSPLSDLPPEGPTDSRAVAYRIADGAATIAWEWRPEPVIQSYALGEVDVLPETGNRLITNGWMMTDPVHAWIVELDPDNLPLSSVTVSGPDPWNVYRAHRLPR